MNKYEASPIANAYVRVMQYDHALLQYEDFFMSDAGGKTMRIPLYAPSEQASLDEQSSEVAYALYHVEVRKQGFQAQRIHHVQVFANVGTTLSFVMLPCIKKKDPLLVYNIPRHHLCETNPTTIALPHPPSPLVKGVNISMLHEVIIPTEITVHLGRPDQNAENLRVPFIYYLKNVASSEIYPTWPYESLKANIIAQISLALNRVFTEWYPSRNYPFDITNSTAFDQAFVKNRNLYDNVSLIVDGIFNEYLQKRNFQEPYFAEYCDGKIAQCPGMKQWGTLDLANRGYDAIAILQYYYGDQVHMVTSDRIQPITPSYPGTPLRLQDEGEDVAHIQAQLNGIAINYPNIKPIFPVNGYFGAQTDASVRAFQQQFGLGGDGIVGKATYYKISFIYVAVRRLAELTSLGHLATLYTGQWQEETLRQGARGVEVQLMQYWLSTVALFYPEVPSVAIDGRFGTSTTNAVKAFQRRFDLTIHGLVGEATWDRLYLIYTSIADQLPSDSIAPYPGFTLQLGSSGEEVQKIQTALARIAQMYPSVSRVQVDGVFGNITKDAIVAFQRVFNLVSDGVVGPTTWNLLFTTAAQIKDNEPLPTAMLLQRLNIVAKQYSAVPFIPTNENNDETIANAITSFQRMMGLTQSGQMDEISEDVLDQMSTEIQTIQQKNTS